MKAVRKRRLREMKVEITTEDEYDFKELVSDTETDFASRDDGDTDSESSSLGFDGDKYRRARS